jgi:hypothetical protein
MPQYGIRPIDRFCGSYGPGHQVHWIQAKKSAEQGPMIHVSVVVHDDGCVDLEGPELKLTMWNHDPDRLRDAVDYAGRAVWKPRFHVLAVPGPSGYLFYLAALDERTPCHPGARRLPATGASPVAGNHSRGTGSQPRRRYRADKTENPYTPMALRLGPTANVFLLCEFHRRFVAGDI